MNLKCCLPFQVNRSGSLLASPSLHSGLGAIGVPKALNDVRMKLLGLKSRQRKSLGLPLLIVVRVEHL